MIVNRDVVDPGDELPCHESNILDTRVRERGRLEIWYLESNDTNSFQYSTLGESDV